MPKKKVVKDETKDKVLKEVDKAIKIAEKAVKDIADNSEKVQKKEKKKVTSLDLAFKNITKKYGGIIQVTSDYDDVIKRIPTGSINLDSALNGGIPLGRCTELYGDPSSGKSSLCLSIISQAQKKGLRALYVDSEHAFNKKWAMNMRVNLDDMLIVAGYTGEENLEAAQMAIESGMIDLVCVDSVPALIPTAVADRSLEDPTIGALARLMNTALSKIIPLCSRHNVAIIFINQTRTKIGKFPGPQHNPGGVSLPFFSSLRIKSSGINNKANRLVDNSGKVYGMNTSFEIIKSKISTPFLIVKDVPFLFNYGYDNIQEVITIATDLGIIEKKGSWFSYEGKSIGQGSSAAKKFFEDNYDVYIIIKEQVLGMLGLK